MKQLLRRLLILSATVCFICTLAILVGRADTRPDELQQLGFDVCDGSPCYLGIVPGVTSWEEAKTKFGSESNADYLVDASSGLSHGNVGIYASSNGRTVGETQQYVNHVSLHTLITRYGTPCKVILANYSEVSVMNLIYPHMDSYVTMNSTRLAMDSAVSMMSLTEKREPCVAETKWKGFAALSRYAP